MEVKYCVRCKKMFQYLSGPPLCKDCKQQDEDEFKKIKDYLHDNPKATVTEIATDLEISADKITKFLKDGRLEIAADSPIKLTCEKCGNVIVSGRLCQSCTGKLKGDLMNTSSQIRSDSEQARSNSMMKFLKSDE